MISYMSALASQVQPVTSSTNTALRACLRSHYSYKHGESDPACCCSYRDTHNMHASESLDGLSAPVSWWPSPRPPPILTSGGIPLHRGSSRPIGSIEEGKKPRARLGFPTRLVSSCRRNYCRATGFSGFPIRNRASLRLDTSQLDHRLALFFLPLRRRRGYVLPRLVPQASATFFLEQVYRSLYRAYGTAGLPCDRVSDSGHHQSCSMTTIAASRVRLCLSHNLQLWVHVPGRDSH